MFKVHEIDSLVKKRKKVGRGGSRGGQSGRGGKGQTARSGGSIKPGFEGGQMPLHRRLPKKGFNNNAFAILTKVVNVMDLEAHFIAGDTVNRDILVNKKLIKLGKHKVCKIKLLGDGNLSKKLHVSVDACSKNAQIAIEKVGGTVTINAKKE
jgi:large subunit ribosomal protein L15